MRKTHKGLGEADQTLYDSTLKAVMEEGHTGEIIGLSPLQ